jgi:hypothetical protein
VPVEILMLLKAYKPMTFFGVLGILFILSGLGCGSVVVAEFIKTGLITHFPLAILTILLNIAGIIFAVTGVIIHTVNYRILEASTITSKYVRHLRQSLD